jgi:predicted phage terminase large subunit-like protein
VYYVEDLVRGQWSAGQREAIIKQTAQTDAESYGVYGVRVFIEQEPGSGGKESAENTIRNLAGFIIQADRPTGNKVLRAEPFAAQAETGNVKVLASTWTSGYIDRLVSFPFGVKDDVDATSGAFNKLALGGMMQRGTNPLTGYRG